MANSSSWRTSLAALILCQAWILFWYRDTAMAMVDMWTHSDTYAHAFMVPPITLWLILRQRQFLAGLAPRASWAVLVPIFLTGFAWLLGELAAVNVVTQFALVAMLVLTVPAILGPHVAREMMFPLAFLFFSVPFGDFVMPKFMEWTADFTVLGLRATGIPVYQEGLHFVIPSGRWSVVEACSGIRYLIASVVVGALYAYLNYRSPKRRIIFLGVAVIVPLVANWLRAYIIVVLGHLSGNEIATGADHLVYGWAFFGVIIMVMFAIGMRWHEHVVEIKTPPMAKQARLQPAVLLLATVLTLVASGAPHGALKYLDRNTEALTPALSHAPLAGGGWQLSDNPIADWQPAFANPSATLHATLEKDSHRIGIFIAYYRQQNYERKLISSENALAKVGDKNWAQMGSGAIRTTLNDQIVTLRSGTLRSHAAGLGGDPLRLKVWHWYWIDGRIVTSDHLGKLWLALVRLGGRGDDSAAVFVYAPESQADGALADYLATAGAGMAAVLQSAVSPAPTILEAYTSR